jgi:hypothetical protein
MKTSTLLVGLIVLLALWAMAVKLNMIERKIDSVKCGAGDGSVSKELKSTPK